MARSGAQLRSPDIEEQVMSDLKARRFNKVALEMICTSKAWEQKRRLSRQSGSSDGSGSDCDQEVALLSWPVWKACDVDNVGAQGEEQDDSGSKQLLEIK